MNDTGDIQTGCSWFEDAAKLLPEGLIGCCTPPSSTEAGEGETGSTMAGMMRECIRRFRWFLLLPIAFGALSLLLGYYLDAQVTRVLWLILSGFVVLTGTFGFMMISRMIRRIKGGVS